MIRRESAAFYGEGQAETGLVLILDDPDSLETGKFRDELLLLRELLRHRGLSAEISAPESLHWSGTHLLLNHRAVSFVINRSTDFFWEGESFLALRQAHQHGSVYAAPNPFTYATRSDKRLLEPLSCPERDAVLGVLPHEREILSTHIPETRLVREENVEELVARKRDLVFKPARGYASRGLLSSDQVGRSRLRRLLRKGGLYVAQRRVPKTPLNVSIAGEDNQLWTDLRVWAYRGERTMISGRGSLRPDVLDLRPPGGWIPTYAVMRTTTTR